MRGAAKALDAKRVNATRVNFILVETTFLSGDGTKERVFINLCPEKGYYGR
jgi:hypothetical protein